MKLLGRIVSMLVPKQKEDFFSNTGQIICIFQNIPNVDYISEICLALVWKTRMSLNIEF